MNAFKITPSRRLPRPELSVRWQSALIISIPVICLFASIFTIAGLRDKTIAVREQEQKSQQIIMESERLLKSLIDAETGIRGYIITRRSEFLQPFLSASSALPTSLKTLNAKIPVKSVQHQNFQQISILVQQEIANLNQIRQTIDAPRAITNEVPSLTDQLLTSKSLMDKLRREIEEFSEQEKRGQSKLNAQALQWRNLTTTVQWLALVISLLGAFAAWYLFNKLDQELAEQAIRLRASNLYFRAVFNNVVDGIIILNDRGYIQSANAASGEIFGYEAEEFLGKHLQRLFVESFTEDSGKVMNFFVGRNQDKLRLQQETIGLYKDGKIFPMEFAISTMEIENEHLFIAILRDITERKQSQETLLKQAQLLDLANDSIMVRDLDDTILYWNQGAQRLYGFSSSEAIGQAAHILLKTEFSQPITEIAEVLCQNGYWNGELLHYKQDGKPVTVASGWTLQCNESGEPIAYLEINQDITARKQSEAALRKSEELYRTLVKNFPNGAVFLFNEELRYTIAHGLGLATLNLDSEALTGKTIWEILPPETSQVIEPIYRQALKGKSTETEIPFDDRFYRLHVLPVINADGEILSGMAMTQDITESKKSEAALRSRADELARITAALAQTTANLKDRNSELDNFAYIVSHDLKAPLRAIANLSSWIEEDLEDVLTADTRHQMHLLRSRVHRMEALINGLLQYSRVGRMHSAIEQVDIEELLKDVIDSLAPPPDFSIKVMPGMPTLMTERLPLEQVFANLISNGIKHNQQPNGQIIISVQDLPAAYEFAVTDNGIGIKPEFHEKIFVIFQTLGSGEKVENTGIGLAIVKKIIEEKGGTITVESQLGKGATFRFTWLKQFREKG